MIVWFLSFAAGLLAASVHYGRPAPAALLPALLRLVAVTLVVALALDAPAGGASPPPAKGGLDVVGGWGRGTGFTAREAAPGFLCRKPGPLRHFWACLRVRRVF